MLDSDCIRLGCSGGKERVYSLAECIAATLHARLTNIREFEFEFEEVGN